MPRHSHRNARSDVRVLVVFLVFASLLQVLMVALSLRDRPRPAPYAATTNCLVLLPVEADDCRAPLHGHSV